MTAEALRSTLNLTVSDSRFAPGVKLLIPAEIGGVTLLVEVVPIPGSEPTSRRDYTERVQDMFIRAQDVIEQIAVTTAELRDRLTEKSRKPDQLEIQFGIKFAAQGQIIIAGASAEASLSVRIIYASKTSVDDLKAVGAVDDHN